MSGPRDPYEVLGVPRSATTQQIRAAYVERARRAHPDLVGHRGLEIMRTLNEAWAILKDQVRRDEYDATATFPGETAGGAAGGGGTGTSGRPFWHGAAGKPPGRPSGPVLDFGIYAGWSLGEIATRDRGYLYWLRDRSEARAIRPEIMRLIDPDADDREPPPGRRR